MNPLQEHPNLFANRNFKVTCDLEGDGIYIVAGYEEMYPSENEYLALLDSEGYRIETPVDSCTLIARPIEDMTDEEISEMYNMEVTNEARKFYINGLKKAVLSDNPYSTVRLLNRNRFLYLLSIGVYPFDQSHFEDGTVIKSTNNE